MELKVEVMADQDAFGMLGDSPSFESFPAFEQK
jgi:hypothetical protein